MATNNNNQPTQYRTRINKYIKALQVRLINEDGSSEIVNTRDALLLAQDQGLDLVEINFKAVPPIVKIIDYGKFCYEEKKQKQIAKKNQQVQELKELTIRPNIADNDLNHKIEQAKSFLSDGNRVKVTLKFRGREISHISVGRERIEYVIKQLEGLIIANPSISLEGKFMSTILSPIKK